MFHILSVLATSSRDAVCCIAAGAAAQVAAADRTEGFVQLEAFGAVVRWNTAHAAVGKTAPQDVNLTWDA